ncbi:hypothetical protein AVEN_30090-1 [Araneus ventricosus]|uniref:Uncharacterized protein n=1 Tax=Araneus ventricosus TaxID=182803 RepID=A0A4Y2TN04_ARAVE|nr:hypothetical protein AVEN_174486-1 [Araneus ventricosus]GBO02009.1 hypothetical protein AVEN_30090-1 [Araneus ventricosus]
MLPSSTPTLQDPLTFFSPLFPLRKKLKPGNDVLKNFVVLARVCSVRCEKNANRKKEGRVLVAIEESAGVEMKTRCREKEGEWHKRHAGMKRKGATKLCNIFHRRGKGTVKRCKGGNFFMRFFEREGGRRRTLSFEVNIVVEAAGSAYGDSCEGKAPRFRLARCVFTLHVEWMSEATQLGGGCRVGQRCRLPLAAESITDFETHGYS